MNWKLLLQQLGLPATSGVMGYIFRLLGIRKKERVSPLTIERERFSQDARDQLVQLKKKGLSIPVFTL
jgi:hypothetical protein